VIIVDTNVLLYAVDERQAQHGRSKRWIEQALNGHESVGFAWTVLLGFVRLSTRQGLLSSPLDANSALDIVDSWLDARPSAIVQPTARHAAILRTLLSTVGTAGNLVSDAHLAALCLEHGARICSFDHDFLRFTDVDVVVPE
jgi:toxin-antitoxin system PIN domain toxin